VLNYNVAIRVIKIYHRTKVQRSLPQHVSTSITLSTFIQEVSNSKLVWATPWSKTSLFFPQALQVNEIKCRKIFQYLSNKMQRYTVYYIWKLLYMFRVVNLHPSSGAHTTVSTASGICQTVTATCRYSGR